jgi:type I restriction enzyme, S subunit
MVCLFKNERPAARITRKTFPMMKTEKDILTQKPQSTSAPQGYKLTDVGVIPEEWEAKELGNLIERFINGGTPSTKIEEYWKGNIPWVTGADILNQKIAVVRRHITKKAVQNSSTNVIKKGKLLLVSRTGVGKLAIAPFDIAISQDFTGIYNNYESLDSYYLFWYLNYAQNALTSQNQGTSIQGITREAISSILIPLPPLTEQRAIAAALSDMDALIEVQEKLIAKKRAIKQGAMQELLKPKKGWEEVDFKGYVWFQEGPGLRNWQFTKSGIKVINVTNLENGYLNLSKTDRYISIEEYKKMYRHFEIDENDIVVASSGNSYGKVSVVRKQDLPLLMNTSVIRFKPLKVMNYQFLLSFLKSDLFIDQIDLLITGGAQPNFGPAHLNKIKISIPSDISKQQNIGSILVDMDAEIEQLEAQLDKYRKLKQGMMQELLTGRKRLIHDFRGSDISRAE